MSAHCSLPAASGQVVFLVLCDLDEHGLVWPEREAARTNREDTLHDIRSGELPNVRQVIEIEFIPAEHRISSRDVTESMLAEVEHIRHPNHEAIMTAFDRLIGQFDHDRDLRKHQ